MARMLSVLLFAFLSTQVQAATISGETNFTTLIHQFARAQAAHTPWVGYWWPYVTGGISSSQFEQGASPSQKYDHAYRNYLTSRGVDLSRFPGLSGWEDEHHGSATPGVEAWQGHDLGWAAASILFNEPQNAASVEGVRFEESDLKALLAEYALDAQGQTYGVRVDNERDVHSSKYDDISPNQFFLALTNIMGKDGKAFLMDRHAGTQSWNVPVAGYAINYPLPTDYLGAHMRYRGVYRLRMTARVWWASNNVAPNAHTPKFDLVALYDRFDDPFFPGAKYEFELWLDGPVTFDQFGKVLTSGNVMQINYGHTVMGGTWLLPNPAPGNAPASMPVEPALRELSHPDYIMVPTGVSPVSTLRNPNFDAPWFADRFAKVLKTK